MVLSRRSPVLVAVEVESLFFFDNIGCISLVTAWLSKSLDSLVEQVVSVFLRRMIIIVYHLKADLRPDDSPCHLQKFLFR